MGFIVSGAKNLHPNVSGTMNVSAKQNFSASSFGTERKSISCELHQLLYGNIDPHNKTFF